MWFKQQEQMISKWYPECTCLDVLSREEYSQFNFDRKQGAPSLIPNLSYGRITYSRLPTRIFQSCFDGLVTVIYLVKQISTWKHEELATSKIFF